MNQQEFIEAIKEVVINDSVKGIESMLLDPPGRKPEESLVELSRWFNDLKTEEKNMVISIVKKSVELGVFSFLCVLDGIKTFEDSSTKGQLKLTYEKEKDIVLLNDPEQQYLNELL